MVAGAPQMWFDLWKCGGRDSGAKSGLRLLQVAELVGVVALDAVQKHQITLMQKSGHTGAQYPQRTHLF